MEYIPIATTWEKNPVWVRGDVAIDNLLIEKRELCAVIDFGCLGVGDPACDLAIAWTLFKGKSRDVFRKSLSVDNATWARCRGWALWKALITYAELSGTNHLAIKKSQLVIHEVLAESLRL